MTNDDAVRELSEARDVLVKVEAYLAKQAEMNAALHMVSWPLHAAVTGAAAQIDRALAVEERDQ